MKNILITGASGFIGSHLARKLIDDNFLYLIDKYELNQSKNLAFLKNYKKNKFKFIKMDLSNDNLNILKQLKKVKIIYHCASIVGVSKMKNPIDIHNQVVNVSKNLIEIFKKRKVLFVYFSSSEVYGDQTRFSEKKGKRIYPFSYKDEFTNIRWVYGEGKFFIETCLKYINKNFQNFNYIILRPFNFFGPNQSFNFVIPKMINDLLTKKKITIYKSSSTKRTFTFIDDAIKIIINLTKHEKNYNRIYNIGSKNTITLKTLSNKILKLYCELEKKNLNLFQIKLDKNAIDPILERKPEIFNLKKAFGKLNFEDFEKSLKKTMKSYLKKNK